MCDISCGQGDWMLFTTASDCALYWLDEEGNECSTEPRFRLSFESRDEEERSYKEGLENIQPELTLTAGDVRAWRDCLERIRAGKSAGSFEVPRGRTGGQFELFAPAYDPEEDGSSYEFFVDGYGEESGRMLRLRTLLNVGELSELIEELTRTFNDADEYYKQN